MLNASPVSTTARRTLSLTAALQQHQLVTCRGWVLPARLQQGRLARRSSSRPVVCAAAQRHPGSQAPTNKLQPPTAVATSAAAPTAEPPAPKQLLEEPSAPALTAAGTGGSSSSEAPGSSSADASSLLASVASASTASQPRLSRRPSLQDIQAATSDKLAQLQVVVAEPGAASSTQQLSEVRQQGPRAPSAGGVGVTAAGVGVDDGVLCKHMQRWAGDCGRMSHVKQASSSSG